MDGREAGTTHRDPMGEPGMTATDDHRRLQDQDPVVGCKECRESNPERDAKSDKEKQKNVFLRPIL